jgi:hypothetical protein
MTRKKTTEEFIKQATSVHGGRYSYNNVVYEGSKVKVSITCNVHKEDWLAHPNDHLYGSGCPKCALAAQAEKRRKSQNTVRAEIYSVHGDRYSYKECLGYINKDTKIDIHCANHGWFSQTVHNHTFNKAGCPSCANEATGARCRKNIEEFVEDAIDVHGVLYDYSAVDYKGGHCKVCISCKKHGEFWQEPSSHLSGRGCPDCTEYGFKLGKVGHLYVLQSEDIVKIGITNNSPRFRCKEISRDSGMVFRIVSEYSFNTGQAALDIEQHMLKEMRAGYTQVQERFGGSTECFYNVDIPALLNRIEELIATQTAAQAA